ncbi:hypothetical protein CPA57_04955 [Bombella sp. TMW2.1880]|uniref:Uncharacterized protein n=2 Tax=Bombella TaxID=1654741 RepID=A0A1S8GNW9_9PROT|nr:hypothetical protein [Bombella favorum]OOL17362.1 hypothetical protein AL01_08525 [Bombella intestini]
MLGGKAVQISGRLINTHPCREMGVFFYGGRGRFHISLSVLGDVVSNNEARKDIRETTYPNLAFQTGCRSAGVGTIWQL